MTRAARRGYARVSLMSDPQERVLAQQLTDDPTLADWRFLLGHLMARFDTGGLSAGATLAGQIAAAADELDHHPDLDLRYSHVVVSCSSHDVGGVTSRDVELARRISDLARAAGHAPAPERLSMLEIAIDMVDHAAIRPFWAAVLGYDADGDDDVIDPDNRMPPIWFQEMDPPRTDRNRIHFDLTVPHDVARERVAAAVAAGGRLVSDAEAPAFWVLADPEGNEVCVCTWQGRPSSGTPSGPADGSTGAQAGTAE